MRRTVKTNALSRSALGYIALALALVLTFASRARAQSVAIIPLEFDHGSAVADVVIGSVHLRGAIDTAGFHGIGLSPRALAQIEVRYTDREVVGRTRSAGSARARWRPRRQLLLSPPGVPRPAARLHDREVSAIAGPVARSGSGARAVPYRWCSPGSRAECGSVPGDRAPGRSRSIGRARWRARSPR